MILYVFNFNFVFIRSDSWFEWDSNSHQCALWIINSQLDHVFCTTDPIQQDIQSNFLTWTAHFSTNWDIESMKKFKFVQFFFFWIPIFINIFLFMLTIFFFFLFVEFFFCFLCHFLNGWHYISCDSYSALASDIIATTTRDTHTHTHTHTQRQETAYFESTCVIIIIVVVAFGIANILSRGFSITCNETPLIQKAKPVSISRVTKTHKSKTKQISWWINFWKCSFLWIRFFFFCFLCWFWCNRLFFCYFCVFCWFWFCFCFFLLVCQDTQEPTFVEELSCCALLAFYPRSSKVNCLDVQQVQTPVGAVC